VTLLSTLPASIRRCAPSASAPSARKAMRPTTNARVYVRSRAFGITDPRLHRDTTESRLACVGRPTCTVSSPRSHAVLRETVVSRDTARSPPTAARRGAHTTFACRAYGVTPLGSPGALAGRCFRDRGIDVARRAAIRRNHPELTCCTTLRKVSRAREASRVMVATRSAAVRTSATTTPSPTRRIAEIERIANNRRWPSTARVFETTKDEARPRRDRLLRRQVRRHRPGARRSATRSNVRRVPTFAQRATSA